MCPPPPPTHQDYVFKGRLVGRLYDSAGKPTPLLGLVSDQGLGPGE